MQSCPTQACLSLSLPCPSRGMTYLYIWSHDWYSNFIKLTRIHRLWQCSLPKNWLRVSLCLQFFTILEWCILTPLNSQRKSKSVSSTYFRKHSATGNIFFQTLIVNVCHCFIIWHPVHQFRGNLLENLGNKSVLHTWKAGQCYSSAEDSFSDIFIPWNLRINYFCI